MLDRLHTMNGVSKTPSGGRASSLIFSSRHNFRGSGPGYSAHFSGKQNNSRGFTMPELMIVLLVGTILTAIAIPLMNSAMATMRMNSTVSAITAAISQTRYRAIMNSQLYTLVFTTPNNTYVVTNLGTNASDAPVPLPNQTIALNGGANAIYTFTLCPNGTVYGAGGACPSNNPPPALTATYQGRQTNINVSNVGNVNATIVH